MGWKRVIGAAAAAIAIGTSGTVLLPAPAGATPVCTDGFRGGPPLAVCGNRIFPEAALARAYVQYTADPTGFSEYKDGLAYLAQQYPRWVRVFNLKDHFSDPFAVSPSVDRRRAGTTGDANDGRDIWVIELTDHTVPDAGKDTLFFSLSVHGNERGGLEGGLRAAEDLAMAAQAGTGAIVDGIDNYTSNTGRKPEFHSYPVKDVLAKQAVYLVDFNVDGWAVGDLHAKPTTNAYSRGNSIGTDLNRQMPTVGSVNASRNPLQENEMSYGTRFMREVAEKGNGRLMAYGADIHGELTSRAYVDIMYPAGQFDSVKHRQLMAIAERTKSVIDATLYQGIQNQIEEATGGNEGEGIEEYLDHNDQVRSAASNSIPTKPAHWATVWDTLGYTDTGFIGDYMATDLAVTGMDYEIFLNHIVPDKAWNVYLQENHINASRAIIKTAMAYAITQSKEFSDANVVVDPVGRAGYVFNPAVVTDTDGNGPGTLPGPAKNGIGQDGKPVEQKPYRATNMTFFTDASRLMGAKPFVKLTSGQIAASPAALDAVDSLVLADTTVPADPGGAAVDAAAYWANIKAWVQRGGNLVLTDRGLHGLADLGVVTADKVTNINVYQPYSDISNFSHPLVQGLRSNARQLVEAAILGYGIGNTASPMSVVDQTAFTAAGGVVVGTTGTNRVSLGQLPLGAGQVRVIGGALPTPTEKNDHRFGLRDYGLTYSGLFVMENAVRHDAPAIAGAPVQAGSASSATRSQAGAKPAATRVSARSAAPATASGASAQLASATSSPASTASAGPAPALTAAVLAGLALLATRTRIRIRHRAA